MLKDSFLKYLQFEKNYSDKTIVSYGIDLEKFEEYFKSVDESLDFTVVDADLIRGWVLSLMEEGYTATSVNRKLSSLRSFYRYLLRQGVVSVDPLQKVVGPKKKKPLPVFVREAQPTPVGVFPLNASNGSGIRPAGAVMFQALCPSGQSGSR